MLTLLLGPDDFSKREYIKAAAEESHSEAEFFVDEMPDAGMLLSQDLFSKPKIHVLINLFGQADWEECRQPFIDSSHRIIFIEEKLDKRSTAAKEILKDKKIEVKEFNLPHGRELNSWLAARIKHRGGEITPKALELLAVRLGRDEAIETKFGGKVVSVVEVYNLWQAANEIDKLLALAENRPIEEADVRELVGQNGEVDVFAIINAVADGGKDRALELINNFLADISAADEKTKIIQLNALLSEQFRSLAMAKHFFGQNLPEGAIAEKTGWKSGRIFMLKKISGKFSTADIFSMLGKLESLDEELKTGNTPPHVILDLIMAQLR